MRDRPDKADKVPARHKQQTTRPHYHIERQADATDLAPADQPRHRIRPYTKHI